MSHNSLARLAPLIILVALAALAMGGAAPAQGAAFTVDATHDAVDASPGDGVCADAGGACTLRAAVMETNALAGADEISLPTGTYVLAIPGAGEDASAAGDLDVSDDLTITAPVIVNGAAEPTAVVDGAGLDRVFHVLPAAIGISGVVVQNGSADIGGGIRNEGSLTLTNSTIADNQAAGSGGGLFNDVSGTATLELSTVEGNTAGEGGGGIANDGFVDIAEAPSGVLTITESTINANTAVFGAGISNAGILTLTASTVSANSGTGVVIAGNDTIPGVLGQAEIANSTISGNSGDGISNGGGLTMTNATVAFNSGKGLPRGGFVGGAGGTNTIVALNSGGDCDTNFALTGGHNLDSDGTCGLSGPGDISRGFAGLRPLADNGGPTQTHEIQRLFCYDNSDTCDAASGAIDAGDPAACPATDQRGQPRPFDGDGNGVAVCDIGAYEQQQGPRRCQVGCSNVQQLTPTPISTPGPAPAVTPSTLPATGGEAASPDAMRVAVAAVGAIMAAGVVCWTRRGRR